jgi:uncharacterized protein (DUF58 family)
VKTSLRLNTKLLPLVGLLALLMQIIDPSRAWVILLVGIGGTWIICRFWARGLARSLGFERELRYGWAQVGDRLEERFTLTNSFFLPGTWVAVDDHSNLPDHNSSVATGVDGNGRSQWRILSQCTRRGVYTLGGATLETGDPFGIYTVTLEDRSSSTLAVMPPVVSLPKFKILSSGQAGEDRSRYRMVADAVNASHTREMTPNDPLRLVHWKTTARRNKFYIRQSEETPAGDWWILLDLHDASQLGAGWHSTEEHGVILAASLAAQGLSAGHSVGLAVNGSGSAWHVPRRNEHQQRALLKSLATASPAGMNLKEYLARMGRSFSAHCSLLVVTACTEPEWVAALAPLMWRGVMPTVFLFDPPTFGGVTDGKPVLDGLRMLGAPCHVIPREFLDTSQARPGHAGEWDWRITATGKAVPVRVPDADWRRLA